jgi:hypothetical protein
VFSYTDISLLPTNRPPILKKKKHREREKLQTFIILYYFGFKKRAEISSTLWRL